MGGEQNKKRERKLGGEMENDSHKRRSASRRLLRRGRERRDGPVKRNDGIME